MSLGAQSGSDSDGDFKYDVPIARHQRSRVGAMTGMFVVDSAADMANVPEKVGRSEFSIALSFQPALVDATCWSGYFPMALDIGLPVCGVHMLFGRRLPLSLIPVLVYIISCHDCAVDALAL